MKMNALANASINHLALIDLKIDTYEVIAHHEFIMAPSPIERFIYITKGKVRFHVEGGVLSASDCDMVYLPSETAYRSEWLENATFMVIDLLLQDSDGQSIRFDESPNVLFRDTHGAYRGLLEELAVKADSNGPFDWLERMSLSFKLLCEMARDTNQTELDEHSRKIQSGLNYLRHNFTLDFSTDRLAEMCCLSTGSFRRSFQKCMGATPVEYRNKLRIQKAITLLKTGEYTVGEAAEAVGIRDIKYFGKLFKRHTGVTPKAIKNNRLFQTKHPKEEPPY